jgi:hypothetical protein
MKEMEGKEGTAGSIEVHGSELPNGNSPTVSASFQHYSFFVLKSRRKIYLQLADNIHVLQDCASDIVS